MKRLIVGAALMALAGGASADGWIRLSTRAILKSQETDRIAIVATKDSLSFRIVAAPACQSVDKDLSNPTPGEDVVINEQAVKMMAYCSHNALVIYPQTQRGSEFFMRAIISHEDMAVSFVPSSTIHFKNSKGWDNLKEAMLAPDAI